MTHDHLLPTSQELQRSFAEVLLLLPVLIPFMQLLLKSVARASIKRSSKTDSNKPNTLTLVGDLNSAQLPLLNILQTTVTPTNHSPIRCERLQLRAPKTLLPLSALLERGPQSKESLGNLSI